MSSSALKKEMFRKVFAASSLDEVRKIEKSVTTFTLKSFFLRTYIIVSTLLFNALLRLFRFFWFSPGIPHPGDVHAIVVYVQGMLGDTAVHLPAVAFLKNRFPGARLTVVSNSEGFPIAMLLGSLPYIDERIVIGDHPVVRKGASLNFSDERLRGIRCDLFVNFSPYGNRGVPGFLLREMIFARKLRAKWVYGFSLSSIGKRGALNPVQHYFVKNEPRRSFEILSAFGISHGAVDGALPVDVDSKASIEKKLAAEFRSPKKIALVNPGAKYAVNRWSASRFGEISRWLAEELGYTVILNVSKNEMPLGREVVSASHGRAKMFSDVPSIPELIELLRKSSLCVTTFTGTMHLAALLHVPTVAVFPTRFSVTHWFPLNDAAEVLFNFNERSYSFDDMNDADGNLDAITVRDVQRSVMNVLDKTRRI